MNMIKSLVVAALVVFAGNAAAAVTVHGPRGTTVFSSQFPHVTHVAAVPEADTWAMMAVGLGLVGLRLRRKSSKASVA